MPITKSAVKRARQGIVRHARLLPYKSKMKTMIKKVHDNVATASAADLKKMLSEAYKAIDTAAKKNVIHRNTASRRKSLLARITSKK